jgi:ribonuclease HII
MAYLVGTDEAGYGPNLGPLVISATVWHVPGPASSCDLYRLLSKFVRPAPGPANCRRMVWGDSKVLYQPKAGLALLERGLLAALSLLGPCPDDWQALWKMLAPEAPTEFEQLPWYAGFGCRLPLAVEADDLEQACLRLRKGIDAAGVRLVAIRSCAVFPERFNRLIEHYGNKAAALTHLTLELVVQIAAALTDDVLHVVCDKHGGRNEYGPLVQQHFPEWLVEVYGEGREESVYRWGPAEQRTEIRFRAKAESHLPTALASMASKYLREAAMRPFNEFWCARVQDLRPTAGYPSDAHRFRSEIRETQTALGIADSLLWRER